MLFKQIYDTTLAQAAYLIGCQRTGEALIIDPERDVDRYLEIAAAEGLRITGVAETHIHADFLSGTRELAERTGAHVYLSSEGGPDWQYEWLDKRTDNGSYAHTLLHHGDDFLVGNIRITALHTPGHTPEHMSYLVTDTGGGASEPMGIATGDFVFVGDVGRPDLLETAAGEVGAKEPSARTLFQSLKQFVDLPEYLQVWPGHGAGSACGKALGAIPQSTVGYEKRFNLAVTQSTGDETTFVESILAGQPDPPPYFARMKRENKSGPAVLGGLPTPRRESVEGLLSRVSHYAISARDLSESVDDARITVIDTRPWARYAAGHTPGALHVPLNKSFPTIVGSYVRPTESVCVIADDEQVRDAVLGLIRVGIDHIPFYVPSSDVEEWVASGNGEKIDEVTISEFVSRLRSGGVHVLDVRAISEFEAGHVDGAQNIVHTRMANELGSIPRGMPLYVHCQSGVRAAYATALLAREGFNPIYVKGGGYPQIAAAGAPTVAGGAHEAVNN